MSSASRERTRDDAEIFFARKCGLGMYDLNRGTTTRETRRERIWQAMEAQSLMDQPLGKNRLGVLETYGQAFERIFRDPEAA